MWNMNGHVYVNRGSGYKKVLVYYIPHIIESFRNGGEVTVRSSWFTPAKYLGNGETSFENVAPLIPHKRDELPGSD